MTQLRKFQDFKTVDELKALCKEKGFFIDTQEYEAGGDWITIVFETENEAYQFIYSSFNGRFIGRLNDGTMFHEQSTEFEDQDWYNAILDFLYIPKTDTPDAA